MRVFEPAGLQPVANWLCGTGILRRDGGFQQRPGIAGFTLHLVIGGCDGECGGRVSQEVQLVARLFGPMGGVPAGFGGGNANLQMNQNSLGVAFGWKM